MRVADVYNVFDVCHNMLWHGCFFSHIVGLCIVSYYGYVVVYL